jgi:hypothetical protein
VLMYLLETQDSSALTDNHRILSINSDPSKLDDPSKQKIVVAPRSGVTYVAGTYPMKLIAVTQAGTSASVNFDLII